VDVPESYSCHILIGVIF